MLAQHLDAFISGTALPSLPVVMLPQDKQRVTSTPPVGEQRIKTPLQPMPTTTTTLLANNPTAPQILRTKPQTHKCKTRTNTPGALPAINCTHWIPLLPLFPSIVDKSMPTPARTPRWSSCLNPAPFPRSHNARIISQEAINNLVTNNPVLRPDAFTPLHLCKTYTVQNLEHYGMAMIHPVTGKHITSYRKLMQDPATAEVWMTAFGKDFDGMCQGDDKTNTIGTNAIFMMELKDVPNIPKNQPPTYAKVVLAYRPQKDDPY
jgi:hypothetical protein